VSGFVYWLDIAGVIVFALSGVILACRSRMDPIGMLVLAAVTGIGGGTLRDLVLGVRPVFWVTDPIYLWVIFATVSVSLLGFHYIHRLSRGFLPVAEMDIALNLDLRVALWAFVLVAPAALLAAAMLTILAALAKSFREAQSYMGLVILVPMIPSFWILIDPTRTETWMTLVPLLSQNVLILELVRGEPVNLTWFALSMGTTGVAALILAAVAGTLYNRPRLIFTSG